MNDRYKRMCTEFDSPPSSDQLWEEWIVWPPDWSWEAKFAMVQDIIRRHYGRDYRRFRTLRELLLACHLAMWGWVWDFDTQEWVRKETS